MIRGDRIKDLREGRGLDQGQLAYRADIDTSYVWRLEKGKNPNVSAEKLARVAKVLRTNTDYLVGTSDDPRPMMGARVLTGDLVPVFERLSDLADRQRTQLIRLITDALALLGFEAQAPSSQWERLLQLYDNLPADRQEELERILEELRSRAQRNGTLGVKGEPPP